MADAGDGADAGEKPEDGGRKARRERQPLPLLDEFTTGKTVAQQERSARLVPDSNTGLQLPRCGKQYRQVDAGVPIDLCREILPVDPSEGSGGVAGIDERLHAAPVRQDVGDAEAVAQVPATDPKGGYEVQGGGSGVREEGVFLGDAVDGRERDRTRRRVQPLIHYE